MVSVIKVGFCVAYDWAYLKTSIPRVYPHADVIYLTLDKNRKTWSGVPFEFDEPSFRAMIAELDYQKKIHLYEDDFSLPNLTAMENDTRQRNLMAKEMGKGGWHIQVDSDEYFLDFEGFVEHLKKIIPNPTGNEKPVNVNVCWISLFKKINSGYLWVDFNTEIPENMSFATNRPEYLRARNSGHFSILSPFYAVHETWARTEKDIWFKINNWGHSSDELIDATFKKSYFNFWKSLDETNYHSARDFHPAVPKTWPSLKYNKARTVDEFIVNFEGSNFPLNPIRLWMHNNRNLARAKALINKIL